MKKYIQISAFFILTGFFFCSKCSSAPKSAEKITFQSNQFQVVGELRLPEGEGRFPLVIMVHGDGPAYRGYFLKLKETILRAGYMLT